mmetsp:Transcript_4558/g.13780  ORF Transcript_4558/g.13780 Transcript_4558/m.13780 type:complete len:125 (+) Transcript_4558:1171-1545(+)
MEFELEEAVQDLFKNSPKTVKSVLEDGTPNPDAQVNPVTGEIEDYYYDNGDWFPIPTFRARSQGFGLFWGAVGYVYRDRYYQHFQYPCDTLYLEVHREANHGRRIKHFDGFCRRGRHGSPLGDP